ncbi:hypothetical protein TNCV_286511 [Trichonephila clavipes]|nr:hypothetical protein TNCV_286511 [Trichonephila clavipes]
MDYISPPNDDPESHLSPHNSDPGLPGLPLQLLLYCYQMKILAFAAAIPDSGYAIRFSMQQSAEKSLPWERKEINGLERIIGKDETKACKIVSVEVVELGIGSRDSHSIVGIAQDVGGSVVVVSNATCLT